MALAFREHPLRRAVAAELHARTYERLSAPERISHLTVILGEAGVGASIAHLKQLLERFGRPIPELIDQHYAVDLGHLRVRWELRTEVVAYTFSKQGPFADPFANPVIDDLPQSWLSEMPGEVIAAVSMAIEGCETPERSPEELSVLFDGNPIIGCQVAGGAGRVWSDVRINPDGYLHALVRDTSLSADQAGRLAKRLLDLNTYRAMTLLGLPLAREIIPVLRDADRRLDRVAARMATQASTGDPAIESDLLSELTALATEIEAVTARSTFRFDASRAYYGVVRQRLEELRQQRIEGLQTFTEFLDSRLAPAIATCEATQDRQTDLAERASRLTSLLRARVEVSLQAQNARLLESMDRRAQLQLRLQETVEGLSVIAIGYYGVGLIGYLLKGMEKAGLPLDNAIGVGLAVPLVVGVAWLGLRRLKRRLKDLH